MKDKKQKDIRQHEYFESVSVDLFDDVEIQSPLMPPKRRFKVRLKIRNIKKGQPSICDDIEVWYIY